MGKGQIKAFQNYFEGRRRPEMTATKNALFLNERVQKLDTARAVLNMGLHKHSEQRLTILG
jgi:hypothetical protein